MAVRDVFTVDPEDRGALVGWTAQRAALQAALDTAQRRVAALDAALADPAAVAAEQEATAAHVALAQAQAAVDAAQEQADAAEAESRRFEANDLAAAVAAVDEATRAVSRALAELLRDSAASTSVTATVDGLALRERYRAATAVTPPVWDHTTIPFPSRPGDVIDPELSLPAVDPADGSDHRRLLAVLDRLDERVDAVADLTTAESVHQLVAGNATRSGSSLAVASEGRVPDDFDVIRTPRRGHDILHRLLVLTDPAAASPWTVPQPGPAALLDPVSATWAAGLLPDPARATVRLRLIPIDEPAGGGGTGPPDDPGGPGGGDGGDGGDGPGGPGGGDGGDGPGGPAGGDGPGGPAGGDGGDGPGGPAGGDGPGGLAPIEMASGTSQTVGTDLADPVEVPLSALGLDPLGWVRVAANAAELEQRLLRAADEARRARGEAPPAGRTVVDDSHAPEIVGLADMLAAARAAGRVLAAARALDPQDLVHPAAADATLPTAAAADQVAQRVRAAEAWTDALATDLEAAASATATPDPAALTDRLLDAASAGVVEALPPPDSPADLDPRLLQALARAAASRLRLRAASTPFTADVADPLGTLARARTRADELAGMRLPLPAALTPPFDATARADLATGAHRLAGADPADVRAWLLDHGRVRSALRGLGDALDLAEVLDGGAVLDLRVTQLPASTPDTWAGATPTPPPGTVSLVVQAAYGDRLPATIAGLVIDEWSQPVADDGHDSGLAFHFDQPTATPPQAVLVAVHPDPAPDRPVATWDLDTLLDVVTSTLALARDRATAAERALAAGIEVPDPDA